MFFAPCPRYPRLALAWAGLLWSCLWLLPAPAWSQTAAASLLNYQGRVVVGSTNFTGTGQFKFALVNANGTTTYWSNDGSSTAGSEPTKAVSLPVTSGLYSLALGDTSLANMTLALPASVFSANSGVYLRVWFNDGTSNGSQLLSPDQRVVLPPYATTSGTASGVAAGSITAASLANGAVTTSALAPNAVVASDIAPGTITSTQLAAGSVGSSQLASNLTVNGTFTVGSALALPATTSATSGLITLGGSPFLHAYGSANVFVGDSAGNFTTAGTNNTASGYGTLRANTMGSYNTAHGSNALYSNTTGTDNVASGFQALYLNTNGSDNTAVGYTAHKRLTSGVDNIAIGSGAGYNIFTGNFNIDIGNAGSSADGTANTSSGVIRIGDPGFQKSTYIAGISGATAASGVAVYVNTNGQLGTLTSSARYKHDIRDLDAASDALLALRPVAFTYKTEVDPQQLPQFGLVAEEVEKVCPDLVAHDEAGQPYTVRYEAVNAMLLNEFLKEHRQVQTQNQTLQTQAQTIQALTARLDALEAVLRRPDAPPVPGSPSADGTLSDPAPAVRLPAAP